MCQVSSFDLPWSFGAVSKPADHHSSFNIWAFTAAAKAFERRTRHSHHRHRSRSRDRSKHPSRSGTSSTGPSAINGSKIQPLTQGDIVSSPPLSRNQSFTETDTPPTGHQSTIGSTAASTSGSAAGSQLDLTKPIISMTSANLANEAELDDSDVQSEAECSTDSETSSGSGSGAPGDKTGASIGIVTVSGREPMFSESHIVCERISTHGKIRPFEPVDQIPALDPALREKIGQIHGDGAIQRWLEKRAEWDEKYSSQHQKWRDLKVADRRKAEQEGFLTRQLQGERPPLCSLVGWYDGDMARAVGKSVDEISGKTSNMMMMWQKISQKVSEKSTMSSRVWFKVLTLFL